MPVKSLTFFNALKWHLFTILENKPVLLATMGFNFLLGIFTAWQLSGFGTLTKPSLGDTLFVVYGGPGLGSINTVIVSAWLLNILFFLLLIARLVNEQTNTSDYTILLRVASRTGWLWGILASIFIWAFLYASLLIVCAIAGIGLAQGWQLSASLFFQEAGIWESLSLFSFWQVIGLVWPFLFFSSVIQGLLLVFIMIRIQKTIWGIFIIVSLALLTLLLGSENSIQGWQIWLPSTQWILSRHYPFEFRLPVFTLTFSYLYNAIFALLLAFATMATIKYWDFLGDPNDYN